MIRYEGRYRRAGASAFALLFPLQAGLSFDWSTARLPAGTYEVQVLAYDDTDGSYSEPAMVEVEVSHALPPSLPPTRYEGEHRTPAGAWQPLFALQAAPRVGLYLDALPEGAREFRVRAEEGGDYSDWSDPVAVQVVRSTTARPPAPSLVPAAARDGALRRLEVWSDLECAGGVQLGFLGGVLAASDRWEVGGLGELRLRVGRGAEGWALLAHRRVLRAVYASGYDEWRIASLADRRDERGAEVGEVECASPLADLGVLDPLSRREADGSVSLAYPQPGLTRAEHLGAILDQVPAWWFAGPVDGEAERCDLTMSNAAPLRGLQQLAEVAKLEIEVIRSGSDGYFVALREGVGRTTPRPTELRYARNNRALARTRLIEPAVTRVAPVLGEVDGWLPTIASAAWPIAAVDAAGRWVSLGEQPIAFDHQLDGRFVQATGGGACILIEDTDASGQRIRLASVAGLAPGMELHVRADAHGTELVHLDHPQAQAVLGVLVRDHQRTDIPPTTNLLGAGSFFDRYSAPGVADGWEGIQLASAAEDRSERTRQHGAASWRVVMEAAEAEVRSAWRPIHPTERARYLSAQLTAFQLRGAVRLELEVEDRGGTVHAFPAPDSDELAYSTVVNDWIANLGISGIDVHEIGGVRARIRIRNHTAQRTEIWLDAAMLTPTPGGAEVFYLGRYANELWRSGNRLLVEKGGVEAAYEVDLVDLERLAPQAFRADRLVLGGDVRVVDEELGLDVLVRLLVLERDLLAAGHTRVELATRVETLTESLVELPQAPPPRPPDPSARRTVPRIASVEVELGETDAAFTVRGNVVARSLWVEELQEGVWASRTRFAREPTGTLTVARDAERERRFRFAASDEGDVLGPWTMPQVVTPLDLVTELPPVFEWIKVFSAGIGRSDILGSVADGWGEGGRLYVWLSDDPTAPADGVATLVGRNPGFGEDTLFALPGGGSAKLLNDVAYNPAIVSAMYLEYVSTSGLSTGQEAVLLRNRLDEVIDAQGQLRAGSIRLAAFEGTNLQPLYAVAAVPSGYIGVDHISVSTPQGLKLHSWDPSTATYVRMTAPLEGTVLDGQLDPASNLARIVIGKAHSAMSGGGDIHWGLDGRLSWSRRFISLPNSLSQNGYFSFTQPAGGVMLGTNGWPALFWRVLVGSTGPYADHPLDSTGTGWFVMEHSAYVPPPLDSGFTDFLIAVRSADNGSLYLFDGRILEVGQTIRGGHFIPELGVRDAHILNLHGGKILADTITSRELHADSARIAVLSGTVAQFEAIGGGFGDFVVLQAEFVAVREIEARTLTALQAQIGTLSGIRDDLGVIVAGALYGQLDALNRRPYINLNATGSAEYFIWSPNFKVRADGPALFTVGPDTAFGPGYDPTTKETPAGAQSRADAAYSGATAYTDARVAAVAAGAGNRTWRAVSAPAARPDGTALVAGDTWLNSSYGDRPHTWTGALWQRAYTIISGGDLETGSVTADRLSVSDLVAISATFTGTTRLHSGSGNSLEFWHAGARIAHLATSVELGAGVVTFYGYDVPKWSVYPGGAMNVHTTLQAPYLYTSGNLEAAGEVRLLYPGGFWNLNSGNGSTNLAFSANQVPKMQLTPAGDLLIKGSFGTFSPEPPRPLPEMQAADWAAWAGRDVRKPNWPGAELPHAAHPLIVAEARRQHRTPAAVLERETERHQKDVGVMAWGAAGYVSTMHEAFAACGGDFARFLQLMGFPGGGSE